MFGGTPTNEIFEFTSRDVLSVGRIKSLCMCIGFLRVCIVAIACSTNYMMIVGLWRI